jgi:formylaminopyrimidine deformylase / aminopyrimidine aminohydrolase
MAYVVGVDGPLWRAATGHRFLDDVRLGTIGAHRFDRWLVQDALFVDDLLVFQARLLARSPRLGQSVLANGCVALVDELDWFEVQAARRGLDLNQAALPATLAYRDLLGRLDARPFTEAVTGLWVLERVYEKAWAAAASPTSPFAEIIDHWATPEFSHYVSALGELATVDGQQELIDEVLTHEVAFWDMALA